MRELKFRFAKAKNFICFGPDGIEIRFDDYGNIINVWGGACGRYSPQKQWCG